MQQLYIYVTAAEASTFDPIDTQFRQEYTGCRCGQGGIREAFMRLRLVVLLLVATIAMFAQSDRGTITGTIADPAGAVVANATIEARNVGTGSVFPVASSATGNYTIAQLPSGNYEINVSVPGFKKYTRQGLTVQAAQTVRVDIALEVGSAAESVTVTEETPLLKTESGDLSHVITTERLDALPLMQTGAVAGSSGIRNPYNVVALMPGSYYSPTGSVGPTVRINGGVSNSETVLIEGMDATNSLGQGASQQNQPGADSIQEWAVQTSNYAAEFGQAGNAIMNVTMRSGTNQYHGSAYEYYANEAFNAGQPFTNDGNGHLIRTQQRRNDYGYTIGGPVRIPKVYDGRNKSFFFFNWEQYLISQKMLPAAISVPTAAYRQGNFLGALLPTKLGTDPLGNAIFGNQIYDPTTRVTVGNQIVTSAYVNNTIPSSQFDPVAAKIQNLIPVPTNSSLSVNNFQHTFLSDRHTEVPSIKVDQSLGSKDKLSFFWNRTITRCLYCAGALGLPQPIDGDIGTYIHAHSERLNWDHTLSPTLLLHLGAGWSQNDLGQPAATPDFDACGQLGLCGPFDRPATFPVLAGLTNATSGGVATLGQGSHSDSIFEQSSGIASLTWVKNNHTFKFGGELRNQGDLAVSRSNLNGTYTFSQAQTALPYVVQASATATLQGNTIGFPYASFLLGLVNNAEVHPSSDARLGKVQWGFYAQDNWKITRKLTLDYGLRYDYSTRFKEQYGRSPDFSAGVANPSAGGHLGAVIYENTCNCNFGQNYPFAFGPRLGVAYQITSKTVLRAGFGIAYTGTPQYNLGGGAISATNPIGPSPNAGLPIMTLQEIFFWLSDYVLLLPSSLERKKAQMIEIIKNSRTMTEEQAKLKLLGVKDVRDIEKMTPQAAYIADRKAVHEMDERMKITPEVLKRKHGDPEDQHPRPHSGRGGQDHPRRGAHPAGNPRCLHRGAAPHLRGSGQDGREEVVCRAGHAGAHHLAAENRGSAAAEGRTPKKAAK